MISERQNFALQRFLDLACVQLGFCLPPSANQELLSNPGSSEAEFVRRVVLAEEMDPDRYPQHVRSLKKLLAETLWEEGVSFPSTD